MREQLREKIAQMTSFSPISYQELDGPILQSSPVVQRYILTHDRKVARLTADQRQKRGHREKKNNKKTLFSSEGRTRRDSEKGKCEMSV